MKKWLLMGALSVSCSVLFVGCDNMSPQNQRIGAAALGGAIGGGGGI